MTILVVLFAAVLSSPDEPALTLRSVAHDTPLIYVQSALDSLDGNSPIAGYGPPYNNGTGSVQSVGPISLQKWFGVRIPVDTARDFVLRPLAEGSATSPPVGAALRRFNAASGSQQTSWTDAYNKALGEATAKGTSISVVSCRCGPVPAMVTALLLLGQSGAMDGLLVTNNHFYQTDFTRPLLFMQNTAIQNKAQHFNLLGSQWGVMNETGNYPGQAWLWLYTMLYQIPPYTTAWAANTDALAIFTVTILTLILMFLPWIPGLNRLPRYLGVYRLIWKDYYREQKRGTTASRPAASDQPRPGVEA